MTSSHETRDDVMDPHQLQQQQLQQWEEFECMQSMFPSVNELTFDADVVQQHEQCAHTGSPIPNARLQYTIHFQALGFGKEIPALEIAYPHGYPTHDVVAFTVRCPFLSREQTEALQTQLTLLATGASGDVVVLQLYQQMLDALTEAHSALQQLKSEQHATVSFSSDNPLLAPAQVVFGRRAIYFHHIINATKRRVVREFALELSLRGFSKIGWPGVVIVEGEEANVQAYVRQLQRLRWQQIVVRGEQTETTRTGSLDGLWRLPEGFQEFPETGMSALAAACRSARVEELFLTTMKIYGRNSTTTTDEEETTAGACER